VTVYSAGEPVDNVQAIIDRAHRVMREHRADPWTGICVSCGGPLGCRKYEAALAILSTYMASPMLVRPYIRA